MSITNSSIRRRDFIASSLIGAIGLGLPVAANAASAQAPETKGSLPDDTSIRPFQINVPESAVEDLRRRL